MKKSTKDEIKKLNKGVNEFKEFISRGNVVDMAVGVFIGGAFGKIVTSLVNDILMPLIGTVLGGLDFTSLVLKVGNAKIAYGTFIQSIVDFLIIAFCIFVMIKLFEKIKRTEEKEEEAPKEEYIILLEEIRDLLKKEN